MRWYKCEACRQPATIHETSLNEGVVTYRHFCDIHGQEMLLTSVVKQDDADFQAMVDHYQGLSDAEKDEVALNYRLQRRTGLP